MKTFDVVKELLEELSYEETEMVSSRAGKEKTTARIGQARTYVANDIEVWNMPEGKRLFTIDASRWGNGVMLIRDAFGEHGSISCLGQDINFSSMLCPGRTDKVNLCDPEALDKLREFLDGKPGKRTGPVLKTEGA